MALGAGCVVTYTDPGRGHEAPVEAGSTFAAMLEQRLDLRLPARVLVLDAGDAGRESPGSHLVPAVGDALDREGLLLPVTTAESAQGAASSGLGDRPFTRARELAALHQAPFALVCRERYSHLEGWTPMRLLYGLLFTLLFVPGESVLTEAVLDIALVDVRSGIVVASAAATEREESRFVRIGASRETKLEHERAIAARLAEPLARKAHAIAKARFLEQGGAAVAAPAAPASPSASTPVPAPAPAPRAAAPAPSPAKAPTSGGAKAPPAAESRR
jgi:hypothetical protein